jgi:uncharacterized RDD family membrane protein YckC
MEPQYAIDQVTPTLVRRLACMCYEGLLVFGVIFFAGLAFGLITQTRHAMDNRHALQGFLFLVLGMYFVWFWSKGQTLAMKTWHLRLILLGGGRVPQSRAMLRYLLAWVVVLPPLLIGTYMQAGTKSILGATFLWLLLFSFAGELRKDRQQLHDLWAGTVMIYETTEAGQPNKHKIAE